MFCFVDLVPDIFVCTTIFGNYALGACEVICLFSLIELDTTASIIFVLMLKPILSASSESHFSFDESCYLWLKRKSVHNLTILFPQSIKQNLNIFSYFFELYEEFCYIYCYIDQKEKRIKW